MTNKQAYDINIDKTHLIGHHLAHLLKEHKTNINQLAIALNIPVMTIRRLLTGETEDPRISTLKLIADHFKVSVDYFISENTQPFIASHKKAKSYLVPKLAWDLLPMLNLSILNDIATEWESVSLYENESISSQAFALESKPSMHPRFPRGTVFIIDPKTAEKDGDLTLVHFKEQNEYTIKELIIDPPEWRLASLMSDSRSIYFDRELHFIMGIVIVALLHFQS